MVSTATRARGSCSSIASRIESEIWSQILSGCPSVTDSDVNRRAATKALLQQVGHRATAAQNGQILRAAPGEGAGAHDLEADGDVRGGRRRGPRPPRTRLP